jgi:hypothetical protein
MRSIEILLVIIIITGAFIIASLFTVLPSPRQVSPLNLRRLALTTLQILDIDYALSETVFEPENNSAWGELQIALSACLPPNIVYNLTVYEVSTGGGEQLYLPLKSISNAESLGVSSDSSSYLAASSNVTFNVIPEKIGESGYGGTLYILNCSDANGWWITGYTAQTLAKDLYNLLSPYFQDTILVNSNTQLGNLLDGNPIGNETLRHAVIINTFGEAVAIPSSYADDYNRDSYAEYCYQLGRRVNQHNWTWVSIVGYPFYYVSNTGYFTGSSDHNTWGIYGMKRVGPGGLNSFLRGLDSQSYSYDGSWITGSPGLVFLSTETIYYSNYYGVYPSRYHTATRALPSWITSTYHLTVTTYVFDPVGGWLPGAIYRHISSGDSEVTGSFFALGLTRTPDIRLTALGVLTEYKPRLYRSEYSAENSRLVVLQLGKTGGI